ncbi:MAG: aconitate hydratase AcnA [Bdellovibrionales bacterium]
MDTLKTRQNLTVGSKTYAYYSIAAAEKTLGVSFKALPYSLKIVLENLLRFEDGGETVSVDDVKAMAQWLKDKRSDNEIQYRPARVLMQDFTGVPAVADLAAMRDGIKAMGGDPNKVNPLCDVDLVIDHSVMVDDFGKKDSFTKNVAREFERNGERYAFLRWAQKAFNNFRVVPPGTGICHQVNLEYIGQVVWEKNGVAFPDTCVGTDSHTTMINGLGVLGWGVGGIEAEAAMLGQPVSMLIPEVVGFKLHGKMREGTTATDLVLTVTQMLRKKGVVNKFVEFYGPGVSALKLADRATIANMAPEYGATCGIFPIDDETLSYLRFTGRNEDRIKLVEEYAKAQGMWFDPNEEKVFTDTLELDLGTVQPSMAGPKRPQDRVELKSAATAFAGELTGEKGFKVKDAAKEVKVANTNYALKHGDVVIAAITSCTNTSNPSVLVAAGLVARKARALGLTVKPWVKTSLAPGSQVVTEYLNKAGLSQDLDAMGFNLVGYGCTTCIGNSGPLPENIQHAVEEGDLVVASVLSGNRNFEGRVNPHCKANYLASPPLVVAYALFGTMAKDITTEPLGNGTNGPVYLKDVWPSNDEIAQTINQCLTSEMFKSKYADVFTGPDEWRTIDVKESVTYDWQPKSTYVKLPPYFTDMSMDTKKPTDIKGAKLLALFGDSITTDHISPAGDIKKSGPAGSYLQEKGVPVADFNSYGARRGNHEVMMRGTFANIRIKNELLGGEEGGNTIVQPTGEKVSIYDAANTYMASNTPTIIIAGKEYGTGSSRDWAAKGPKLLGVKAVIAETFERIHRSNLVGMGVFPLEFIDGMTRADLKLDGTETFDISGIDAGLAPRQQLNVTMTRKNGETKTFNVRSRIDTMNEVEYMKNDGVLLYVLRNLAKSA